jgi:hypothetical protein
MFDQKPIARTTPSLGVNYHNCSLLVQNRPLPLSAAESMQDITVPKLKAWEAASMPVSRGEEQIGPLGQVVDCDVPGGEKICTLSLLHHQRVLLRRCWHISC